MEQEQREAAPRRLSDFIRSRQDRILAAWEAEVRRLRPAQDLSRPALLDHIPEFLAELADYVDAVRAGEEVQPPHEQPRIHALDRLELGFDLAAVVREYGILRAAILELALEEGHGSIRSAEIPRLHAAFDEAIATSVLRYQRARERTLQALDRISTAALGDGGAFDEFLRGILLALAETTAVVDSVVLLLRQGDKLRVSAVVGLPEEGLLGQELGLAEGHPGRVLQLARAVLVRDASTDPNTALPALRESGTHALFGVPLQLEGELVGVAMMGSRTSYEFSREDELLLRTMASRATALIAQARLRRQLEERAAELEAVIRAIPDAVFIGDERGLRLTNQAGLELLGLGSMDELRQPLGDLTRRLQFRFPGERQPVPPEEHTFARALRGETAERDLIVRDPRTREDRVVRSVAAPVRLGERIVGAIAINSDITARQRAADELRAREELLRLAVESTGLGLFDWNLTSRAASCSDRMRELLGLGPDEPLTYARFLDLLEPDDRERTHEMLQRVWASGEQHYEAEFRTRQGRWVSAHGRIQLDSSGERRFIGTAVDITQRKQHEAALQRAAEFQQRIVGIVSHDLRTPLNVIQLSATLLGRGPLAASQRTALGRVVSSTRRAGRLIRDLLDYTSAAIGGGIRVRPQPTDLGKLAAQAVDEARLQHDGRVIHMKVSGEATGEWDPDRLAQLVMNLLGNALQHSPKGTPVDVEVRSGRTTAALIVTNTGPPIPPEVLPTLFEPFRRGPGGERTGGIGLGLYISKEIAVAHGGRIEGRSSAEHGTSFVVTLPRGRPST